MACWRTTIGFGFLVGLAAAGCGDEAADLDLGSEEGSEGSTGRPTSTTGGGAHDVDDGSPPPPPSPGTTTYGEGSSGGVEDTLFGMSDDMPLVADIPDIKRGELAPGTWVVIEQVRPTSGSASLGGREAWFYVQDPLAEEHMGLRVLFSPSFPMPAEDRAVDVQGWVQSDAQGWMLELESVVEGALQPAVPPRRLRLATLLSATALVFDDAIVDVVEPGAFVVTRRGAVPGTVIVGAAASNSGVVLVDLRPFDLNVDLPPGTHLSRLRGVAELGGSRPVILPRDANDLSIVP